MDDRNSRRCFNGARRFAFPLWSLCSLWSLCFLLSLSAEAWAQPYPSKPIRFVVPYPPGGPLDAVARLLGQKISESVRQPVIVDNKPGAGGNIGADVVAKAPPDGYTILMGAVATHAINPTLYPGIPYDAVRDFQTVTQVASTPNVLIVHPSIPVNDVREFIAYAKAHPRKLNFGSGSTGSAGHLAGELFKSMAGIEMTHVPYKGAAPAMQDLIGGQVQLMFDNTVTAWPQVQAGKVRPLGVTTKQRLKSAPDVPAIAEVLPGFEANAWHGIFAPAGTPQPIVDKLALEIQAVMKDPAIVEAFTKVDTIPVGSTPREFRAFIDAETERWGNVVRKLGLTAE